MYNKYLNFRKNMMNKKKKGFTLIEVIIVIAIIGMMISILLPKFTNYINESKKLKVVEQSRKVVMAVESYNVKAEKRIKDDSNVGNIKSNPSVNKYFEKVDDETNKLPEKMTIEECYKIVDGQDFKIDPDTGVFDKLENNSKTTEK